MKAFRGIGIVATVCALALTLSYGSPATAGSKTTDTSDLFWVHTESGWGIQLVQNNNTIFATLFVYGPDNQPTWYSATLTYQSSLNWSGTLYRTTGPWFGAAAFDPVAVTAIPVGTMSFNAPKIASGTLIYSVNGVQVLKTIERQLLVYEDFSGSYAGVLGQKGTGLGCKPADSFDAANVTVQIAQSTTAMTIVTNANGNQCTFPGTYSQTGHFGGVIGSYTCTNGTGGTFDIFEMVRTHADFRARMSVTPAIDCTIKGRMVGLEQPLVPQ